MLGDTPAWSLRFQLFHAGKIKKDVILLKSNMIHRFSNVPEANIQRSRINRSFTYKTTCTEGFLIPFYNDIMYPGDTFIGRATIFGRMATPVFPIMDNLFVDTFYFGVPWRLVWDKFQEFMGEVNRSGEITTYEIPHRTVTTAYEPNTLEDYFGLPTKVTGYSHSILPLRAYALIYNDWFRSDYLQDPIGIEFGDYNEDSINNYDDKYALMRRGKRFDYYTSCLPFPQAGPGVEVSLSGNAPVRGPMFLSDANGVEASQLYNGNDNVMHCDIPRGTYIHAFNPDTANPVGLYADLSSLASVTINTLREAFAMQHFLERLAVGGNRYTEIVYSMFGVKSPDARLQRPEFLGHGQARININPVEQTAQSSETSPQGNLAAYAVFRNEHHAFSYSATEHMIILGLLSIRADLTYQQPLWKQWSYKTREELYWPQFSHLGEQAVYTREIDCRGTESDSTVFGYQERYGECRYYPSLITGLFKSNTNSGLDRWHLSQDFNTAPVLNSDFIEDNPPVSRIVAVPSEPHFYIDIYMDLQCIRPMPIYSNPGLTRM